MPKQTSSLSLTTDEGLDLRPLVGLRVSHWSVPQQHIIEDAVLFNPQGTLTVLGREGIDMITAAETLVGMQERFQRYDEEYDRMIPGNNKPLSAHDVVAIHLMLQESLFFTHNLHQQSHLEPQRYSDAAMELEEVFGAHIPS